MAPSAQVKPTPVDKLWTPANIVTLVRICLVPVFVVALLSPWPQWFGLPQVADDAKSLIAAGIFILISCTDWLDGYLARSRGEVTDFGKFMDPLADKILVAAALLALVELGSLPSWVRMVAASEGVVIAASWYGKFKTVFQMIAIVLFTVKDSYMVGSVHAAFSDVMWLISWGVMIVALVLTVVSMLDYIAKARHLIGFGSKRPRKAPSKEAAAESFDGGASAPSPEDAARIAPKALRALACEVLEAARARGRTVGTAESLTGGLIAATLTEVPGSSAVIRGGVVSYDADVKRDVLGVGSRAIADCGVVSEAVAQAMAEGARERLSCDVAVSVTGIAGPGGAEPDKPVGTVWIACADAAGTRARVFHFPGSREQVRFSTVRAALELVLESLQSSSENR